MSVKVRVIETIDIFVDEGKDKGKAIGFIELEEILITTGRKTHVVKNTWTWHNGPTHFDRGDFRWEQKLRDGPEPKLFPCISFDNLLLVDGDIFNFTRWTIHQVPPPRPWFEAGNTIIGNFRIAGGVRTGFIGNRKK